MRLEPVHSLRLEDHLQGVRLRRCGERRRTRPSSRRARTGGSRTASGRGVPSRSAEEPRRRERVDEARGDRHVLDPERLEVQRRRRAVDADVGDPAAGRTSSVQSSNVSGMPTASIATSAPSPSVSSGRSRRHPRGRVDRRRRHRSSAPSSRRRIGKVDATIRARRVQLRRHDRRPARSGRRRRSRRCRPASTSPFRTPTSYAVGRMSARNSTCSSVSPSGTL